MINYLSLFSGIGAFEKAMINQDIPFNLVGYSEIDKYASKSYSEIHGVDESMNFGDITKIDEKTLPPVDFITYGFPCQDISLAGKQKGMFECEHCHSRYELEKGDAEKIRRGEKFFCEICGNEIKLTRSGLFFDALRIIETTQPKVAIAENVKNLCSKKFAEQFKIVLDSLEEAGYNNYWKILNSKDFGIPQNRERVFIVSIRKDCDTGVFEFPEPYELKLRLKDILEDEVDEKFYISNKMTEYLINTKFHQDSDTIQKGDVCKCLRVGGTTPCIESISEPTGCQVKNKGQEFVKEVDVAGTLLARDYKGLPNTPATAVLVRTNNKKGYDTAEVGDYINIERPGSTTRRGRVDHGVSQTLDTKENHCVVDYSPLRIRKLTPKECFRLMGFDDEDYECAAKVNSNSQLYKQAGNSIVVDVAEELLCVMFDEDGELYI